MITVASVPSAHPYVAHIGVGTQSDAESPSVRRLPDPLPADAEPGELRWWPPRWLDPDWLRSQASRFDVLHIHFGFDTLPPTTLDDVVGVLRDCGKPLVFTVHDLHNPHFVDRTIHDRQLDVLIPAADRVITLTEGAAREIARRWDVQASVVPHPHVAPLELIGRPRKRNDRFVIGVHAKNLRANLDPVALLTVVTDTAAAIDARVRIDLDDEVMSRADDAAESVLRYHAHPNVDMRVHPRFDDTELWEYLTHVDASILPYRFGTHSGWLEACYDVGTAVIAPDCGYYGDQKPCHTFGFGSDRFEPDSLAAAVRSARDEWAGPGAAAASRRARAQERVDVAAAHDAIYRSAVATVRGRRR